MKKLYLRTKNSTGIVLRFIYEPSNFAWAFLAFFVYILILQWLFQARLLLDIMSNSALSFWDKIDFLFDSFKAVFASLDDLTPISFIIIAFCLSVASIMLIRIGSQSKATKGASSLAVGLIGSGCVACGGSLLSPVVSLFASGGSAAASSNVQAIGDILLVLAVAMSLRTLMQISEQYARVVGR